MTTLASGAAALAVLLLLPHRPRLPRPTARPPGWLLTLPAVALVPTLGAVAAIGAATLAGFLVLLRRRRRRRSAAATSARVLETCDLLAAELAAGQPPGHALRRAAVAWPLLAPVAESHDLGSDVPDALREVGRLPGAQDLRLLAAAWVVAQRTGGGLAEAVRRCSDSLRQSRTTARLVEGELASARSTARLVACLPILALLMGSGSGGDPFAFLLGTPAGLTCLAGGLALGFAGLWWIESIAEGGP